jgi:hypothetical protein
MSGRTGGSLLKLSLTRLRVLPGAIAHRGSNPLPHFGRCGFIPASRHNQVAHALNIGQFADAFRCVQFLLVKSHIPAQCDDAVFYGCLYIAESILCSQSLGNKSVNCSPPSAYWATTSARAFPNSRARSRYSAAPFSSPWERQINAW